MARTTANARREAEKPRKPRGHAKRLEQNSTREGKEQAGQHVKARSLLPKSPPGIWRNKVSLSWPQETYREEPLLISDRAPESLFS